MISQLVTHWRHSSHVKVIGPCDPQNQIQDEVIRPKKSGLIHFLLFASYKAFIILKRDKVDVIIAGSALITPIAVTLGYFFQGKVATLIHGLDIIYDNHIYKYLVKFFLPRCDIIFANSTNTLNLAAKLGLVKTQSTVIHPGLDFEEFCTVPCIIDLKRKYNIEKHRIILLAGRLVKRKGIPEFVENVLPNVIARYPEVLLLVVGDNPTESLTHKDDVQNKIITTANKKDLESHVKLLGMVNRQKLLDLYFLSDIFVLPAIEVKNDIEGFGIVLIEASAAQCPVISTRTGGIKDAVLDQQTGILVDVNDWETMAESICQLLADHESAVAMGKRGRARAKHEFDWPIVAKKYLDSIEEILKTI